MPKKQVSYEELRAELDEVMMTLQQDDLDIDKAVEFYKRGLELVQALETYLKTAENKIIELKSKFSTEL